ncbi:hypothetical protein D9V32_09575 [Mycetocola tolaasinivorans]|uniref:CopC domain-containing protein n=1 Tax=Mycetocola tolaasinivorans TaxID=76635 RepID=A0A3L7A5V6_9MICO|nr:copper resistance CopC family protein [Mycetocola tolaasinivorans]RLP75706.1 hypothetical protein D9V32_09575 [Mycetocola tolaasinivorans]
MTIVPNTLSAEGVAARRTLARGRTATLLVLLVALFTAGMILPATSASAHDQLLVSDPAQGSVLEVAPTTINLTFSATILNVGTRILVNDAAGTDWAEGEPVSEGTEASVPVRAGLPNGEYTIAWRVVSSDGHPITGVVPFTLSAPAGVPAPGDSSPVASEAPAPSESAAISPSVGATPGTAAPSAGNTPPEEGGWFSPSSPARYIVIGVGGALAAAIIFLGVRLFVRRDRPAVTPTPGENDSAPTTKENDA